MTSRDIVFSRAGDLSKVIVEHDNSGFRADWFLEKIEIKNLDSNKKWDFPCEQWLTKSKGLSREILARE